MKFFTSLINKMFVKKDAEREFVLDPVTSSDRAFISKHIPQNNADITWSGKQDEKYVLPTNVTAYYGKGRINFFKHKGQLTADVGFYNSSYDAQHPHISPITIFEEKISTDEDMIKLKEMIA